MTVEDEIVATNEKFLADGGSNSKQGVTCDHLMARYGEVVSNRSDKLWARV